ncbi:MAG: hypothetical protein IPM37_23300 [Hahellaceae bacterium]|nr:hypothetical protein [Hahellaceae bacterium]
MPLFALCAHATPLVEITSNVYQVIHFLMSPYAQSGSVLPFKIPRQSRPPSKIKRAEELQVLTSERFDKAERQDSAAMVVRIMAYATPIDSSSHLGPLLNVTLRNFH